MKNIIKLVFIVMVLNTSAQCNKNIQIDCNQQIGNFELELGVNCGPLSQDLLLDYSPILSNINIKHIRTHGYQGACDWNHIFPNWFADPDSVNSYDFSSTDTIINAIVNAGFNTTFRLGVSWEDSTIEYHNDPPGTIRDASSNIVHYADSSDFAKFADICKHIIMHYNEGWADGYNYNINEWEIWNEPSNQERFWSGTNLQFYKMFEIVAKKIKSEYPNLLVGGPGRAGGHEGTMYEEDFIHYCSTHNVPLDFYSWHSYGLSIDSLMNVEISPYIYVSKNNKFTNLLNSNGYYTTKSICNEWNAGLGPEYFAHSIKGASFFASSLIYMENNEFERSDIFRGDDHLNGIIENDTTLITAAQTLYFWKQLSESSQKLYTTGTDTCGFAVISSMNESDKKLYILISNFENADKEINLTIENLPVGYSNNWQITRSAVVMIPDIIAIDTASLNSVNNILYYSFSIDAETVQFIELKNDAISNINYLYDEKVITFPNPTNDIIYVKGQDVKNIKLFSCFGILISESDKKIFDMRNLSAGIYILRIYDEQDKIIKTEKILKY